MKVVDVAEFYADQGGGVKTYINQKLRAGAERGHEVVVIAPGPTGEVEERHGGKVVWIKSPPLPPDPRYFVFMRQAAIHEAIDREQPDVLEGSSPWRGGRWAGRWQGDALKAFIFHQDPVAVYPETLLGWMGRERVNRLFSPFWSYLRGVSERYDTTVVAGHWLADKLHGQRIQDPVAVPFGIDKHAFSPARRDAELRRTLLARCGAPDDAALLVTVSRFHPEKRLGTMARAVELVNKRRPVAWLIFGGGPMEGWLKRRVRKISGAHVFGYTKNRDELANALACGDAFLHGSAAETFGLVVAEALCSGLPLVVPSVGGAADLANPSYAETYEPGDAGACAEAIERLLDRRGDALTAAVADAAAARIGTMDDHFDALFALYERRLHARRA